MKNFINGNKWLYISSVFLLIVAISVFSFSETRNEASASGDLVNFDLGNFVMEVTKTEYVLAPTYVEDMPDIFEISFILTNKAGKEIPFTPNGDFYFVGESGKKYSPNTASMHPDNLKNYHERIERYYKENTLDEKIPLGVYKIGINAPIDRDDAITTIIYKRGSFEKVIDLKDIKTIKKERPTERPDKIE